MRGGRVGRRRNQPPENLNAHIGEDVGEASVHQTQGLPTQGNVVGNDPLFDRLATAIASFLPNPDKDTSIERAIKLGAKHFVGTANPADAEEWMRSLESIFDVMGCSEEKKLRLTTFLLKGVAADWWFTFRNRYSDANDITWTIFRDAFFETYYPSSYKNAKQNEFLRLTQGSMTVSEYHTKFVELSRYALVLVNEENDKCRRFEENLRPDIRAMVTGQGHTRFGPLVEAALRVETALQAGQSQGIQLTIRGNQSQTGTSSGQYKKNRGRFWPNVAHTASFKSKSQGSGSNRESDHSQSSIRQPVHRQPSVQRAMASRPVDGLSSTRYPPCQICGKFHLGKCLKGISGCFICGQEGHLRKDCPARFQERGSSQGRNIQIGTSDARSRQNQKGISTSNVGSTSRVQSDVAGGSASRQRGQTGRTQTQGRVFAMTQQEAEESPDIVMGGDLDVGTAYQPR